MRLRARSQSSSEAMAEGFRGEQVPVLKSVQSAGMSDLLPSGSMRTNCKRPRMCACRSTSRDCPAKG